MSSVTIGYCITILKIKSMQYVKHCVICISNKAEYLDKERSHKNSTNIDICDFKRSLQCNQAELQKSHGYAGITREEGLQNGQSVSCQHVT